MAPMIDMVFLLLVFFMCVSTLAQAERQIALELPESEQSQVPDHLAGRGIVSIDAEGGIYLGATAVDRAVLISSLRQSLREQPELTVQVRADRQTLYESIKPVLKACAEAGAFEIIYATHQR